MRFLHLGDLHLGKVVNGFLMLNDQRLALERLLEDAKERQVDALVIAGDLYDSAQPSGAAMGVLSDFFTQAFAQGIEIFAVPGNHDSAERVGYATKLLARQNVHVAGPFTQEVPHVVVKDEFGSVTFWLLPFVRPVDVRLALGDATIGTNSTRALQAVVEHMAIDPAQRNVLVAHQFVTAGGQEPLLSDSESVWVGGAGNVDASVFDPFDYVALGHIHRPQKIGRDTIRYAGSLLKYSLSEAHHTKSAVLVELGPKGELSYELMPIRAPHDLREIKGPLAKLIAPQVVAAGDSQDYIYAILTDSEAPLHAFQQLRAHYPHLMAMEVESARAQGANASAPVALDVASMDPLELFGQFFTQQNGRDFSTAEQAAVKAALDVAFSAQGAKAKEHQGGEVA